MKIALITTLPALIENKRISDEADALGHNLVTYDMSEFSFSVQNGSLETKNLENFNPDVIIVRGIFNSIKAISVSLNSFRKKGVKIFDNNFLEHRYSIDKVTDLLKLSINGVKVPDMVYLREFTDYQSESEKLGYPVIVKSTRTGKGVGIEKVNSSEELRELINRYESEGKSAKSLILQKFIPYKYDLRCLVIDEQVFTMRRIPKEGEFRANFSLGGDVELFDLDEEGKKLAATAMKAIDMSVGGVDILITENNDRYILEVNHTAGFVGMEKATGINIGKIYLEHAIAEAR